MYLGGGSRANRHGGTCYGHRRILLLFLFFFKLLLDDGVNDNYAGPTLPFPSPLSWGHFLFLVEGPEHFQNWNVDKRKTGTTRWWWSGLCMWSRKDSSRQTAGDDMMEEITACERVMSRERQRALPQTPRRARWWLCCTTTATAATATATVVFTPLSVCFCVCRRIKGLFD